MIKEVEISVLNMLILNLEKNFENLQEAYDRKDSESFNQFKKLLLKIQSEIYEVIK